MEKLDLRKQLPSLYSPKTGEPVLVEVPALKFLMADGAGDPNRNPSFQEAVDALFTLSYTLKFASKRSGGADWAIMPLEGLWWAEDMRAFAAGDKKNWLWTLMIAQPDHVTGAMFRQAVEQAGKKKPLPAPGKVRLDRFHEGTCVQVLHVGPFSEEGPVIGRMHSFAEERGYRLRGKHHEIYLSDMRHLPPEKWKTVLRQPVEKA